MQIVSAQQKPSQEGQSQTQQTQSKALSRELIDRVFDVMSFAWGAQFLDKWRDVDVDELKDHWAKELGCYTPQQIAFAMKTAQKTCVFAPSLPDLHILCQQASKKEVTVAAHQPAVLTLPSRDDPDAIAQARARCMETAARLGMVNLLPPSQ